MTRTVDSGGMARSAISRMRSRRLSYSSVGEAAERPPSSTRSFVFSRVRSPIWPARAESNAKIIVREAVADLGIEAPRRLKNAFAHEHRRRRDDLKSA